MADWFAKLMQRGQARTRALATGARTDDRSENKIEPRDPRYDAIVQMLRDREAEDRDAREKRQRWYRQSLDGGTDTPSTDSSSESPVRLYKFSTKVPCRVTPEAGVLLEQIRRRFSGCTISFQQVISGRQALMLTGGAGTERKQIGWIEHFVETNPRRCNARNQGLTVELDGDSMLVLRFRYPSTAVTMTSKQCDEPAISFAEIRTALDQRPSERTASPGLVWLTRPELDAMKAVQSRDYEAFYVRFKLELQAAIWSVLSTLLASAPSSQWHRGICYGVVTEPDATMRKICQKTVDDSGHSVDIGLDRIYDAAPATDILLLYLEGDILADLADIYFTLQSLNSSDAYFLKEEFFAVIHRFWTDSQSLASRYGSDLATVARISQRAMPMPTQAPLLKQDWINLRQLLVDRYGRAGRNATDLLSENVYRPAVGPLSWQFSSFPPGEINFGLRLVYRQEWRHLGPRRGDMIRMVPQTASGFSHSSRVETTIEQGDTVRNLGELVDEIAASTIDAMKWPRDFDGSIHTGVRSLSIMTDSGLESESRESSSDLTTRLTDIARRLASDVETGRSGREARKSERGDQNEIVRSEFPVASSPSPLPGPDEESTTYVYSKLQDHYEVLTRPAEIHNVVLIGETLPAPAEIDLLWVRRHDWILSSVLLDESFRDALNSIHEETRPREAFADVDSEREELDAKRDRFYEHLRANILHYQQAIWRQEDPQQRSMRYRKSGKKVPLEWRFELEVGTGGGGALTIDDFSDRLSATNVDARFATYSGGREANLDQLIDPAGPIGYYGNYAIYRMRPEFGSDDFFSMLHFFKSPYLRPSAVTGLPEVEDPAQIRLAQDPAIAAPSDAVIEQHREEMLEYLPELQLELARPRTTSSDVAAHDSISRWERQISIFRRHFAAYLFRRERARRIALDSDGVVIDVVRYASESECAEQSAVLDAVEGHELVLQGEHESDVLCVSVPHDSEGEWLSLREGPSQPRAGRTADLEPAPSIVARDHRERIVGTGTSHPNDSDAEPGIFAQRNRGEQELSLGEQRAHAPDSQSGILPQAEPTGASGLLTGQALDSGAPLILAPSGREVSVSRSVKAEQQPRRTVSEQQTGNEPPADRSDEEALALVIFAGNNEEETTRLRVGPAPEAASMIMAPNDEDQTLCIANGRALDLEAESGIRPQAQGEWPATLLVSRAHDPNGDAAIRAREEEVLRLTAVDGGKAAHPHEKAILAGGDEEWMTTLLAGPGIGRIHERVILAQEDEWLRPSLVAG